MSAPSKTQQNFFPGGGLAKVGVSQNFQSTGALPKQAPPKNFRINYPQGKFPQQ